MEHEALIRLSIFIGLFALLAAAEAYLPRRARQVPRKTRWRTNWGFSLLNTGALRLLAFGLPLLAVGAAIDAAQNGWGLFNLLDWPSGLEIVLLFSSLISRFGYSTSSHIKCLCFGACTVFITRIQKST